ncbi:MAG TPA: ABC transporter substrate-binding protein, partial [Ramlibacter sp.]
MKLKKTFAAVALGAAALFGASAPAHAQFSGDVIRIGIITDMSSVYADIDGQGGVEAIRMAIADAGGNVAGKKIEVLSADHQNKPDVAATKAREWFDTQGLDMLIGGTNSGTNLAMAKVAAEKKKPFIAIGAATSALTNDQCTPYTLHWAYDTTALAKGTGAAVVKQGGKTWFFLTADYAFGHQLQADTTKVVEANGGKVVGSVRAPLNASDFSSFLLQAQGSKAQILGLANAGGDTINSIKAANEFGITKTMKLAGLLVFINDIHSLGLNTTQVVEANGGKVVGSVKAPLNASDFSSFLLQAQGSKAQILGLANAGGDTINSIKAANEFGVTKTMKLAGLLVFINDIHSLGL